jgi:hypothetical protein
MVTLFDFDATTNLDQYPKVVNEDVDVPLFLSRERAQSRGFFHA